MSASHVNQRRGPGRRPGHQDTRSAILAAARARFARGGYSGTSLRAIAADAGVDAALIAHFFGSKQQLFAAAVELPYDPEAVVAQVLAADRSEAGHLLATAVIGVLESDGRAQMLSLIRSAATEPESAEAVRTLITARVLTPLVDGLGVPDAALRASLVSAQIVGLIMARYVVQVPPLAELQPDRVVALLAPLLQRLLTEDLPK